MALGVHGGRRRSQDTGGPRCGRQAHRDVAGLQPGRPVALVGGVVLLVDDHDADIGQRGHDGQPGAHDDVDVTGANAPPLIGPFAIAESRVDEREAHIQVRPDPIHQRQRHRDLRYQDEDRPAALQAGDDRFDVDRGLAAAGHAVEQEWRGVPGVQGRDDRRDRSGLRRRQVACLAAVRHEDPPAARPGVAWGARGSPPRPGPGG